MTERIDRYLLVTKALAENRLSPDARKWYESGQLYLANHFTPEDRADLAQRVPKVPETTIFKGGELHK